MKQTSLTLKIVTAHPDIERLVPDWERLVRTDPTEGFFRSPSWYLAWIRHIRPNAKPLVIAVRNDEQLVAIAPFCIQKQNGCLRKLSLAGSDVVCGEYLDIIALPDFRAASMQRIWDALLEGQSRWDLMSLDAVRNEGNLFWDVCDRARKGGLMIRYNENICPFIELPSTFELYFARLSRKRRKHFARAMRVFKEQGIELKTYTSFQELGPAIEKLSELHTMRWKKLGKPGTLGQRGFRDFLRSLAQSQHTPGAMRIHLLEENGNAKAALLNFHSGKGVLQFQNGFDPHWALTQHSPGTVLVLHAIKEAIEEGLLYYDFLRGAEDYKFHFADRCKSTANVYLASTLKGRAYLFARDLRARLGRRKQIVAHKAPSSGTHEWVFVPE